MFWWYPIFSLNRVRKKDKNNLFSTKNSRMIRIRQKKCERGNFTKIFLRKILPILASTNKHSNSFLHSNHSTGFSTSKQRKRTNSLVFLTKICSQTIPNKKRSRETRVNLFLPLLVYLGFWTKVQWFYHENGEGGIFFIFGNDCLGTVWLEFLRQWKSEWRKEEKRRNEKIHFVNCVLL